jgi:uncharacterized protein (DUF2164 family)
LADKNNPIRFELSDKQRSKVLSGLKKLYYNEFDEELSDFQAEKILAYFIKALGPPVYNQAIGDARALWLESSKIWTLSSTGQRVTNSSEDW